jgi:hypothetical protein
MCVCHLPENIPQKYRHANYRYLLPIPFNIADILAVYMGKCVGALFILPANLSIYIYVNGVVFIEILSYNFFSNVALWKEDSITQSSQ